MLSFNYSLIDKINKRSFKHSNINKVFLEGPPFISGKKTTHSGLHMGHALVSYIKSTLMNYYNCDPWTGSDNHGLPTEMLVMDILGLKTPSDIERYGVDKFNSKCKEVINEYENKWDGVYDMIGREWNNNYRYKTCSYEFMSVVWKVFNKLYEKGHIYSGVKILPFDISAKCCLSNFEANQEYKNINVNSLYVKFKIINGKYANKWIMIWTTTPWTLLGNKAICVNKDGKYVISDDCIIGSKYCDSDNKNVIDINDIIGCKYLNVLDEECIIVCDDYVDCESDVGTGCVHLSPFFGEDDYRVCKNNNIIDNLLDTIIIDDEGNYTIDTFKGRNIFDKQIDKDIITLLKSKNMFVKQQQINHSYPFSPRTHQPLIYKACHSYFVKITDKIRQQLISNVYLTNWNNESAKNRLLKWLENATDWCISRNRYFGTPIPVFISDDGDIKTFDAGYFGNDIHPEFMHDVISDNKIYRWCGEVFDCWFESGCVGIYSMSNNTQYISDFVVEGIDQTTNWFYVLLILSLLYNNTIPYKNVICSGLILDKNGKKFSKSSGNYVIPEEIISKYGSDSVRLYLVGSIACDGGNLIFNEEDIKQYKSKLIQYYNAITFFVEYYNYYNHNCNNILTNLFDNWILNRVDGVINSITNNLNNYIIRSNVNIIMDFIEDFTNYYIKFNRNRINGTNGVIDQLTSLSVMYTVIKKFNTVLNIYAPFSSDSIDEILTNIKLEEVINHETVNMIKFETFKNIIITVRKARSVSKSFSSVKRCISDIIITLTDNVDINEFIDYIKEECNCLNIIINYATDVEYKVKLDYNNINREHIKHYQSLLKDKNNIIKNNIKGFIITKSINYTNEKDRFKLFDNGILVNFSLLDTQQTNEMNNLRELINSIQMKRKELGLHVYDKIIININKKFKKHSNYLESKLKADIIFNEVELFEIIQNDNNIIHGTMYGIV